MPYVEPGWREQLDNGATPRSSGDLNYLLTKTIIKFLAANQPTNYEALNAVDGVLGLCQNEFRRRIVNRYEDGKIMSNGDVYDELLELMGFD